MSVSAWLLGLLLGVAPSARPPSPSPPPPSTGPIILFLIDNSASLPPLDPEEKRVAALEKMFTFLQGQPYRLILFGGRKEIFVDDPSKYNNRGQWTDFYFALAKARDLMGTYPPKTAFRLILLTDGLLDPGPPDWEDMNVPKGADLKEFVGQRATELVRDLKQPLYVILVGEAPKDGFDPKSKERAPTIILDLVRAANGPRASSAAQSLAAFFRDDGLLLRKFIFRVEPDKGLKAVEPIVRRITAGPKATVEFQFLTVLVLPFTLLLLTGLGMLVRSFPGPGDTEVIELSKGLPVHVVADKVHRLESGGWGTRGLTLVGDAKEAVATFTYQAPPLDLTGIGVDTTGLDPLTLKLLPMGVDELKRALDGYNETGSKEEKIYVLNLDYMAKNMDPKDAERNLTLPLAERRRVSALDFLRAKTHLLSNDDLRRRLTDARVRIAGYGKGGERKDLYPGNLVRVGPYGFSVKDVARGGRRDVRLILYYDQVPSLFGLKTWIPDVIQRAFRFRRSSQRVVS